jgi:dipeptidyl aminopeptidase/acylaminoacyl peptidase
VGGNDQSVIALNQQAMRDLRCEKRLHVIPGATHLFSEPGALEEVARLAGEWFQHHFAEAAPRRAAHRP